MADEKPRKARRAALGMGVLFLVWVFGVWPPPVWWRDHWPRETAMMREAAGTVRPTPLADISPLLQRMVVIGEDSRFWTHHGIDAAEIADALGMDRSRGAWWSVRTLWRRRARLRGASTITQQLARNLYLSPSRSPPRKFNFFRIIATVSSNVAGGMSYIMISPGTGWPPQPSESARR